MDAWERVGESHEATLRFGSRLEDLECYVDNSLKFNEEGDIVGRSPGIKGWLHDNAPRLYDRYTTVMRYKAMSKKLRQIAGLKDPVSASAIIAAEGAKQDYAADEIQLVGEAEGAGGVEGLRRARMSGRRARWSRPTGWGWPRGARDRLRQIATALRNFRNAHWFCQGLCYHTRGGAPHSIIDRASCKTRSRGTRAPTEIAKPCPNMAER